MAGTCGETYGFSTARVSCSEMAKHVERAGRVYVSAMDSEAWRLSERGRCRRARRVESYVAMVMRLAASNARPPVSLRDLDLLVAAGDMARTLGASIATHQAPIVWAARAQRSAEAGMARAIAAPALAHIPVRPACEPRPVELVRDPAPAAPGVQRKPSSRYISLACMPPGGRPFEG